MIGSAQTAVNTNWQTGVKEGRYERQANVQGDQKSFTLPGEYP
jgi:hypothetical protein